MVFPTLGGSESRGSSARADSSRERPHFLARSGLPDRFCNPERRLDVPCSARVDVRSQEWLAGERTDQRKRQFAFFQVGEERLSRGTRVTAVVDGIVDELEGEPHSRAELPHDVAARGRRPRARGAGASGPFEQ